MHNLNLMSFFMVPPLMLSFSMISKTNEAKIKKIMTDLICFIIHLHLVHCIRLKNEVKVKINILFVIAIV